MNKINTRRLLKWGMTAAAAILCAGSLWCAGGSNGRQAIASTSNRETVNLRIIGTTDLHGQLNSKDYEQGVDYSNGGLARLSDLIKKTKSEVPAESVITVDAGDTLFDYTTEYIFAENQLEIQPIYKAMSQIGYDAITLGNHEFDYGYDYLLRQLNGSGMRNITVVSNVTDSKTGEYPFLENMLITRTLTSSAGNKIEVQIGIIGQTIPTLTSKTHSYAGILKTEDMVENAKKQAKKLKEMGADVIIALSHTGIGPEKPELNFKNVAYALTKIEEIDVVVCGHEHNLFPTTDMTSPYYLLPNVDRKTFLMNGKNVIMAGNRGSALGVVDLTLNVYKDTFRISERSSELRMVTEKNTTENKTIASSFGAWEEKLLTYSTDVIAKLKDGELIQNFFGMIGDNSAIQLLNDSKIDYAQRYVQTAGAHYQKYPIIAVSTYMAYGEANASDFINIHDAVTESELSAIQPYNNYIYLYTINGKQLKEWLEWSASAYETTANGTKWMDGAMNELMNQNGIKSLLREEWLNDWSSFYIFDGVDYEIDPFSAPRYDLSGNRIGLGERIKNLSYNGKPVTNDMVFLLAANKITKPTSANKGVETQVVLGGFNRSQTVLSKYMKQLAADGNVVPQPDYNWRVNIPVDKSFIVKVPRLGSDLFKQTDWYQSHLKDLDSYSYFKAFYPAVNKDQVAPHIVATPAIKSATASPYKVAVQVTDRSEVTKVRYLIGREKIEAFANGGMSLDAGNTFTVAKNGTYTIYAEDQAGNKNIYVLTIDNFRDDLLSSPTIDSYTNRKSKISGRGEPNTTIVFEASTGIFESKVSKSGTFSYALPSQPSGSYVTVYLKDEEKGLVSEKVNVLVKRTGPNQPYVNPIVNTNGFISGELYDDDASVIAIVDDTVYVPKKGGKALYQNNSEIYNASLKIVEVGFEKDASGYFSLLVPPQAGGKNVTVYSLDHLSRNSRVTSSRVIEVGPNAPVVDEITNIENTLRGYVPASTPKAYYITITFGKTSETVKSDDKGYFNYQFREQLRAGDIIKVTAYESKDQTGRNSYTTEIKVKDIEEFVRVNSEYLSLNRLTDRSYLISGTFVDKGTVYLAISNGTGKNFQSILHTVETEDTGRFRYRLDEKLESGSVVYAMVRFDNGKIYLASKTEVLAGRPDTPELLKDITNTDKKVQIVAKRGAEIVLTIGDKEYRSATPEYDEKNNRYLYPFEIDRAVSGTVVKVYATNAVGNSDTLTSVIMKAAPDQPTVNDIKAGAKKITGKVELLDYVAPDKSTSSGDSETGKKEEIPEHFKDAPEKVAKTQTRIYAQIGKKSYEGEITNSGKFTIKIPAQKAGTQIVLYAMNKAGRGPLIKVKVK